MLEWFFMLKKDPSQTAAPATKLYCFSPPVMLATFLIETIGAAYVAFRYKLNRVGQLSVLLLICLGVFQLAEYLICEKPLLPGLTWARIGYVAITILPPLGISLAMAIARKKSLLAQIVLYTICAAFIIFFLFIPGALSASTCLGNYVIFQALPNSMYIYALYYYGLLIIGTSLCFYWSKQVKVKARSQALFWLAIGYLAFILPTTTVNLINPLTISGIPSIMCGFAVLMALTLIFKVMPLAGLKRNFDRLVK